MLAFLRGVPGGDGRVSAGGFTARLRAGSLRVGGRTMTLLLQKTGALPQRRGGSGILLHRQQNPGRRRCRG